MKNFNIFRSISSLFIVLTLVIGSILVSETPRMNVGYADSDEFLAVADQWGVAHAPGYVWYTGVLHVAMRLPIPGTTPAQRAHLVSVLSICTAIFVIAIATQKLLNHMYGSKKQNLLLQTAAISIALGTVISNQHLFLYSVITEKYVFTLPFIALIYYATVSIQSSEKSPLWHFVLLGGATAFLITHHQSMIFLLPFIGYVLWMKLGKEYKHYLPFTLTFVSVIIVWLGVLYIRMQVAPEPTWQQRPGLPGLFDMVTRADFRGTLYYKNETSSGYFHGINAPDFINAVKAYLTQILSWFYWWVLIPIAVAALVLYKFYRSHAVVAAGPFVLIGVLLAGYLGWSPDITNQAATIRFYIPSIITLVPLLAIGVYEIITRLQKSFSILGASSRLSLGLSVLPLIAVTITVMVSTKNSVAIKDFTLISQLYSSILDSVEPQSIVTCYSDPSCFALLYEQAVNHRRPDVDIVPIEWPLLEKSTQQKKLQHFTYDKNPYRMFDIVTWNIDKRPVYAVDISQYYFSMFGLNNGITYYIPTGYSGKLTRQMPSSLPSVDYSISKSIQTSNAPKFDLMRRVLINSLSQTHFTNAFVLLKIGEREQAQQELSLAMNIAYSLHDQEKAMAGTIRTQIEKIMPLEQYGYGKKVPAAEEFFTAIPELLEKGQNSQAVYMARAGITVDPLHAPSRLELAKMYILMGDKNFARTELQHVLMIDPASTPAAELLRNL